MSNSLTPADLQRITAYCEAATTRPLRINRFDQDDGEIVYQIQADDESGYVLCSFGDADNPKAKQDAEFEVQARLDLPRAVATLLGMWTKLSLEESAITSMLLTIGGMVEGLPTQRINFLQRLRQLVVAEQERDALSEAIRKHNETEPWSHRLVISGDS